LVYRALSATANNKKWSGREAHPYLGFIKHGEAAARSDDGGFLLGSMTHSEDGVPVILRPRRGAGRHQGASTVPLGSVVELGQHRIDLAVLGDFRASDGLV
jgi:hypothetical protein